MKCIGVLILLLSSLTFADEFSGPLKDELGTPYQILKDAFEKAGPASLSDFSTADEWSATSCLSANRLATKQNVVNCNLNKVVFSPYSEEMHEQALKVTQCLDTVYDSNRVLVDLYTTGPYSGTFATIVNQGGDLQTLVTMRNKHASYNDVYRKRDGLVFIHEVVTRDIYNQNSVTEDSYIYCFPWHP